MGDVALSSLRNSFKFMDLNTEQAKICKIQD